MTTRSGAGRREGGNGERGGASGVPIHYASVPSPIGPVFPAWRGNALVALYLGETTNRTSWSAKDRGGSVLAALRRHLEDRFGDAALERASAEAPIPRRLARYFAGDVGAIESIPVDPGGTPLQSTIWALLRTIPAGRTWTYGELAAKAGVPGAARAAGGVVGANPIAIVIPCHRIVGKSGALTGFGGGLARKQWLLEHEGVLLPMGRPAGSAPHAGSGRAGAREVTARRAAPRA